MVLYDMSSEPRDQIMDRAVLEARARRVWLDTRGDLHDKLDAVLDLQRAALAEQIKGSPSDLRERLSDALIDAQNEGADFSEIPTYMIEAMADWLVERDAGSKP